MDLSIILLLRTSLRLSYEVAKFRERTFPPRPTDLPSFSFGLAAGGEVVAPLIPTPSVPVFDAVQVVLEVIQERNRVIDARSETQVVIFGNITFRSRQEVKDFVDLSL